MILTEYVIVVIDWNVKWVPYLKPPMLRPNLTHTTMHISLHAYFFWSPWEQLSREKHLLVQLWKVEQHATTILVEGPVQLQLSQVEVSLQRQVQVQVQVQVQASEVEVEVEVS